MSISLPQVIQMAANLANGPAPSAPIINPDLAGSKPVVICHTRDVDPDVFKVMSRYSVVETYAHDIHANLDPALLGFGYLFVDMRNDVERLWFQKFVQGNLAFHSVLYKWTWESDMGVSFESEFSEFPPKQARKQDWDKLLLTPPIGAPTPCLSFLGIVAKCGLA